jgi:hypothetical protein
MVGVAVAETGGATASMVGFIPQAANICCNNIPLAPRPAIFSKSRRDIRFMMSPFFDEVCFIADNIIYHKNSTGI